ncbi:hepatocellular carcinoma-associated antigen 59-domain-containing protein [Syncephalis plumigaleata]|nr:hepatocellular carcinoma-associated antigen 59-domain-containing protein [Syncephalis plumigaleata]
METNSSTTRRKNYRRKQRVDEDSTTTSESVTTTTTTITTEESANETIEDLLELQRLRRRAAGMNTHKLQAPLEKKKKNKDANKSTASQDTSSAGADTEKKSTLAFTGQTNIVDVDKHMMAYIEKEMRKQKDDTAKDGQGHYGVEEDNNDDDDEEEEEEEGGKKAIKALDPFYALYMAAEKNKLDSLKEKEAEGNLTNSSAMLTKVQEVDLGMDARLRNIEKTEKAKRKLQEDALSATGSTSHIMDNVPSRRFYLPPQNSQSMLHPSQQMATDHAVAERFKKYQRRV